MPLTREHRRRCRQCLGSPHRDQCLLRRNVLWDRRPRGEKERTGGASTRDPSNPSTAQQELKDDRPLGRMACRQQNRNSERIRGRQVTDPSRLEKLTSSGEGIWKGKEKRNERYDDSVDRCTGREDEVKDEEGKAFERRESV